MYQSVGHLDNPEEAMIFQDADCEAVDLWNAIALRIAIRVPKWLLEATQR